MRAADQGAMGIADGVIYNKDFNINGVGCRTSSDGGTGKKYAITRTNREDSTRRQTCIKCASGENALSYSNKPFTLSDRDDFISWRADASA